MIVSPAFNDLDYQSLVNWDDPLTHGLVFWHLNLPGRFGGTRAYDLVSGRVLTRTGMASPPTATSGPGTTTRRGGWGEDRFDGTNDYVALPTLSIATRITIAFSVKYASSAGAYMFINKETTNTNWNMLITGGLLILRSNTSSNLHTAPAPSGGVWHRIVGTIDGTVGAIYVDGRYATTVNGALPAIGNSAGIITLGNYRDLGGGLYLNGAMDDVMLLARAWDARDVWADYVETQTLQGHPRMLRRVEQPWGGAVAAGGGFQPAWARGANQAPMGSGILV